MTKLRLFLPILVAVSLIGMPAQGAEAMNGEQPQGRMARMSESAKQAVSNAKKSAQAQFKESVDRFNRCIRGKCTKTEALKAARDVAIAATATIAAMYVTGAALKKGARLAFKSMPKRHYDDVLRVLEPVYDAGMYMQMPGEAVVAVGSIPYNRYMKNKLGLKVGDSVRFLPFKDFPGIVRGAKIVGFSATGLPVIKDPYDVQEVISFDRIEDKE